MARIDDYRHAAELMQPKLGKWTYDRFAELSAKHFCGEVPLMPILWVPMAPYGQWVGLAERKGRILLWDKHALDADFTPGLYAEHIVLHEMLHQYLYVRNEDSKHNGHPWCREIMRIGVELGIHFWASPSRPKRVAQDVGTSKIMRRQETGPTGEHSIPLDSGINRFPHFAFDYKHGVVKPEYKANNTALRVTA